MIKNLIYGIILGIGFIIPGVSGGVLATILGIYDEIIFRLNNFPKNFKNNIIFFLPLFGGIIISIILFSNLILYLLNTRLEFISYIFMGLILGCVPFLVKEIKLRTNKNINFILTLFTFFIGFILYIIELNNNNNISNPNIFMMLIAGFGYAIGKIVPGISGSAILIFLGLYKYFLNIIANPFNLNFNIIIEFMPFIISFIISAIIIIKLINYLLNKHFRSTYSAIIGFVLSSILFIYPHSISFIALFSLFLSFIISYTISSK